MDFALLYIIIIFVFGSLRYNNFLSRDKINKYIWIFIGFLIISVLVNRYEFDVEWEDILKTARNYLFVLGFFVLRRFRKEELWTIVNKLFYITTFMCVLYVIQGFSGIQLLTGHAPGITFPLLKIRGYNIPMSYYFFIFYAFFTNPFEGKKKYASLVLYVLVVIISLHRGLLVPVFALGFLGIYYTSGGLKGIVRYLFFAGILIIPIFDVVMERFESDNSSSEFSNIAEGAFVDYDQAEIEGTFLFRIALFYERYEYVTRDLTTSIFGAGFMHESSKITEKKFDFKVGQMDEKDEKITQLDTGDIAWMPFILRLGFLGTILYLCLYFFLCKTFYKARHDKNMLVAFLYMVLLVLYSFTSIALSNTFMIIFPYIYYILYKQGMEESEENEYNN